VLSDHLELLKYILDKKVKIEYLVIELVNNRELQNSDKFYSIATMSNFIEV
jgi:hypothetical protein